MNITDIKVRVSGYDVFNVGFHWNYEFNKS